MGSENELNADLHNIMTDFNKVKEVDKISNGIIYFYRAIDIIVIICIHKFSVLFEGANASTEVRRNYKALAGRKQNCSRLRKSRT
jgi:hypothetical protein